MSIISSLQNAASGLTTSATTSAKRGLNQTLSRRGLGATREATANQSVAQANQAQQALGNGVQTARNAGEAIATAVEVGSILLNPAFWIGLVAVFFLCLVLFVPVAIMSGAANNDTHRTLVEVAKESGCDLETGCTYQQFANDVVCKQNQEELKKKYGNDVNLINQAECKTTSSSSAN